MSGSNTEEELMDFTCSDGTVPQQSPTSHDKPAEAKEEIQVTLKVEWSEGAQPQKCKVELEKILQTWANKSKIPGDCRVLNVSEDGNAMIRIQSASVLTELQRLNGQTLKGKGEDAKTVKIMSISLTSPELTTQIPDNTSMNLPPSSEQPDVQMKLPEKSSSSSSAAVSTAGVETCPVPVSHFWYVNHIYKEEIKRIMKENGVKFNAEVNVTFEADQKDGDPQKALSEFVSLVQRCLGESDGSVFPLKYIEPEELKDTLKIIQRSENKLLLTLSSEEITVCGPRQSQDAFSKSLNATTKTSTSTGEATWASEDTSLSIGMSIKDPLVTAGLTMEKDHWRLITTSFEGQVAKIKAKFGVDLKVSDIGQGNVEVKACYKRSGGNVSMESHAVRALLHLYQKIATSPMSLPQHHGAMGYSGLNMSNVYQPEGASGGPVLNGQSEYSMHNTAAPTEEGATAGDGKDENCPICMDTFTNKKQLKCKHEFCEECLARAKKVSGPICPVCKDVFGTIEGDQPEGTMSWHLSSSFLPGFSQCGTIVISYDIPSGIQTKKHPNPGKYYHGAKRIAYLPDNKEGREVLRLLKKAFDQKLIFTVGTSRTTGMEDQVTWNDIHHKTSTSGGPQSFGYPDPGYLSRVRDELKAKGIE